VTGFSLIAEFFSWPLTLIHYHSYIYRCILLATGSVFKQQQDSQFTYNITLKRVSATIVAVEKNK